MDLYSQIASTLFVSRAWLFQKDPIYPAVTNFSIFAVATAAVFTIIVSFSMW